MHMLYNSDSYAVVQIELPAAAQDEVADEHAAARAGELGPAQPRHVDVRRERAQFADKCPGVQVAGRLAA